jgi:hypothetical protein
LNHRLQLYSDIHVFLCVSQRDQTFANHSIQPQPSQALLRMKTQCLSVLVEIQSLCGPSIKD